MQRLEEKFLEVILQSKIPFLLLSTKVYILHEAFHDRWNRIRFLRNNLSLLSSRSEGISGKSQAET